MKLRFAVTTAILLVASFALAQPAANKSDAKKDTMPAARTISSELHNSLRGAEREFVEAADAMPEDQYSFAPTAGEFKGVRTFALQVKHVATVNYLVGTS